MSTQQKDLSYFKLRLQEHLNSSFPEKASNQKLIEQRSSWAANECDRLYTEITGPIAIWIDENGIQ